jgi:hypothetical protein
MKNLPLGIQTFKNIIEEDYLYIDKTKDIYELLAYKGKYFFLSRPRRFGKSLLISTLKEIFSGNQELFKGLWIYDKIDWKKYPVVRIDFSNMLYTHGSQGFEESFFSSIRSIAEDFKIELKEKNYKDGFKELLKKLSKVDQVVLLIDEYDKPITNFVDDLETAKKNREILKNFYETIKASDQNIKFAFLTGVSKFSKVSVFSGLNNLRDITLDEKFATITGYTEKELFSYFDEYIVELAKKLNVTEKILKNELKRFYNGYSWDGKNFVYNPFSILYAFTAKKIENYWFQSGTPTFLIKLIKEYSIDIKKLERLELTIEAFSSYEVDKMNVEALLFQTGYLTIKEIIEYSISEREYVLSYPNIEVKDSLLKYILDDFVGKNVNDNISIRRMIKSLQKKDLKEFFMILTSLFGSIPHEIFPEEKNKLSDNESYYHTIFYLIFKLIGVNIQSEISVSKGRIDAVVETEEAVFIFEFKIGRSPKKAIEQIQEKFYYESYLASKKEILLVGVTFSISKRNIKDWKVRKLKLPGNDSI